jgi:hypothetical protein
MPKLGPKRRKHAPSPFRCTGCCEPRQPEDTSCPDCRAEGVCVPLRVEDASRPGSRIVGPRARKFEEAQLLVLDDSWRNRRRWPSLVAAKRREWLDADEPVRTQGIVPVGTKPVPGKKRIPLHGDWIQELAARRRAREAATRPPSARSSAGRASASRRTPGSDSSSR